MMDRNELELRFNDLAEILKSELTETGFWTGKLSSSALATAVAIVALRLGDQELSCEPVVRGINWLIDTINGDGGFGDSPGSVSNVSTTLLSYAALRFVADDWHDIRLDRTETVQPGINTACLRDLVPILHRMEHYLGSQGVDLKSTGIIASILGYYGKDYTFSVPILSMLVICRVLDSAALDRIPRLPFELALLPSSLYRFFNMQVVSYAIPALMAVGIYLFKHQRPPDPVTAFVRTRAVGPGLDKLLRIMPESGGFLEAIPLTAFVSMCLIRSGYSNHKVVSQGIGFLKNLQRPDGSWPIDTDLSTWVTTLGIKALGNHIHGILADKQMDRLRVYLLDNQYQQPHPFNNADPGGWGWSSFSGSVPDADDTAGAILALMALDQGHNETEIAVLHGCLWLAGLQNRDGGIPTFCRGWGRLPFDRSCADLTGHTLLAWIKTMERYGAKMQKKELRNLKRHVNLVLRFLKKEQRPEGYWLPLWFGNQFTGDKTNPVYGTSRVMVYLQDALACCNPADATGSYIVPMLATAGRYLSDQQNDDGSWGAKKGIPGTMEETALAICALATTESGRCEKGFDWLDHEYQVHGLFPKPIGLYFASLWYYEKMYPQVYYLEALGRVLASHGTFSRLKAFQ